MPKKDQISKIKITIDASQAAAATKDLAGELAKLESAFKKPLASISTLEAKLNGYGKVLDTVISKQEKMFTALSRKNIGTENISQLRTQIRQLNRDSTLKTVTNKFKTLDRQIEKTIATAGRLRDAVGKRVPGSGSSGFDVKGGGSGVKEASREAGVDVLAFGKQLSKISGALDRFATSLSNARSSLKGLGKGGGAGGGGGKGTASGVKGEKTFKGPDLDKLNAAIQGLLAYAKTLERRVRRGPSDNDEHTRAGFLAGARGNAEIARLKSRGFDFTTDQGKLVEQAIKDRVAAEQEIAKFFKFLRVQTRVLVAEAKTASLGYAVRGGESNFAAASFFANLAGQRKSGSITGRAQGQLQEDYLKRKTYEKQIKSNEFLAKTTASAQNRLRGAEFVQRQYGTGTKAEVRTAAKLFGQNRTEEEVKKVTELGRAADKTEKSVTSIGKKGAEGFNLLTSRVGVFRGHMLGLERLVSRFVGLLLLRGIANQFKKLVGVAFEFQKNIEQMRLGFAETLSVSSRLFDSFSKQVPIADQISISFKEADIALDKILDNATKFGLPAEKLAEAFAVTAGAARSGGVALEESIDIITQLTVLAQRIRLPFNVVARDIRDIFTGLNVSRTVLGNLLGISQKEIQTQRERGKLAEFLLDKLRLVGETLKENLKTLEGQEESIKALFQVLARKAGGGFFTSVFAELNALRTFLAEINKGGKGLDELRRKVNELAAGIKGMVLTFAKFVPLILKAAAAFGAFRVASGIGTVVGTLGAVALVTKRTVASKIGSAGVAAIGASAAAATLEKGAIAGGRLFGLTAIAIIIGLITAAKLRERSTDAANSTGNGIWQAFVDRGLNDAPLIGRLIAESFTIEARRQSIEKGLDPDFARVGDKEELLGLLRNSRDFTDAIEDQLKTFSNKQKDVLSEARFSAFDKTSISAFVGSVVEKGPLESVESVLGGGITDPGAKEVFEAIEQIIKKTPTKPIDDAFKGLGVDLTDAMKNAIIRFSQDGVPLRKLGIDVFKQSAAQDRIRNQERIEKNAIISLQDPIRAAQSGQEFNADLGAAVEAIDKLTRTTNSQGQILFKNGEIARHIGNLTELQTDALGESTSVYKKSIPELKNLSVRVPDPKVKGGRKVVDLGGVPIIDEVDSFVQRFVAVTDASNSGANRGFFLAEDVERAKAISTSFDKILVSIFQAKSASSEFSEAVRRLEEGQNKLKTAIAAANLQLKTQFGIESLSNPDTAFDLQRQLLAQKTIQEQEDNLKEFTRLYSGNLDPAAAKLGKKVAGETRDAIIEQAKIQEEIIENERIRYKLVEKTNKELERITKTLSIQAGLIEQAELRSSLSSQLAIQAARARSASAYTVAKLELDLFNKTKPLQQKRINDLEVSTAERAKAIEKLGNEINLRGGDEGSKEKLREDQRTNIADQVKERNEILNIQNSLILKQDELTAAVRRSETAYINLGDSIKSSLTQTLTKLLVSGENVLDSLQEGLKAFTRNFIEQAIEQIIDKKLKLDKLLEVNFLDFIPGLAKEGGDKAQENFSEGIDKIAENLKGATGENILPDTTTIKIDKTALDDLANQLRDIGTKLLEPVDRSLIERNKSIIRPEPIINPNPDKLEYRDPPNQQSTEYFPTSQAAPNEFERAFPNQSTLPPTTPEPFVYRNFPGNPGNADPIDKISEGINTLKERIGEQLSKLSFASTAYAEELNLNPTPGGYGSSFKEQDNGTGSFRDRLTQEELGQYYDIINNQRGSSFNARIADRREQRNQLDKASPFENTQRNQLPPEGSNYNPTPGGYSSSFKEQVPNKIEGFRSKLNNEQLSRYYDAVDNFNAKSAKAREQQNQLNESFPNFIPTGEQFEDNIAVKGLIGQGSLPLQTTPIPTPPKFTPTPIPTPSKVPLATPTPDFSGESLAGLEDINNSLLGQNDISAQLLESSDKCCGANVGPQQQLKGPAAGETPPIPTYTPSQQLPSATPTPDSTIQRGQNLTEHALDSLDRGLTGGEVPTGEALNTKIKGITSLIAGRGFQESETGPGFLPTLAEEKERQKRPGAIESIQKLKGIQDQIDNISNLFGSETAVPTGNLSNISSLGSQTTGTGGLGNIGPVAGAPNAGSFSFLPGTTGAGAGAGAGAGVGAGAGAGAGVGAGIQGVPAGVGFTIAGGGAVPPAAFGGATAITGASGTAVAGSGAAAAAPAAGAAAIGAVGALGAFAAIVIAIFASIAAVKKAKALAGRVDIDKQKLGTPVNQQIEKSFQAAFDTIPVVGDLGKAIGLNALLTVTLKSKIGKPMRDLFNAIGLGLKDTDDLVQSAVKKISKKAGLPRSGASPQVKAGTFSGSSESTRGAGTRAGDVFGALYQIAGKGDYDSNFVRNSLINAGVRSGLSDEDIRNNITKFTQTLLGTDDLGTGIINVKDKLAKNRNGVDEKGALQGVIEALSGLPTSANSAALAVELFVSDSIINIARLKREVENVSGAFNSISSAAEVFLKTGDLGKSGESLANQLSDGFTSRIAERLIQGGAIGAVATRIGIIMENAAEKFLSGDISGGNKLVSEARAKAGELNSIFITNLAPAFNALEGFRNSFGGPGLNNQTSVGFATPSFTQSPGPSGVPSIGTFHGKESIRSPEQEDKVLDETRQIGDKVDRMLSGGGQGNNIYLTVEIDGKDVAARVKRISGGGNTMVKPSTKLGLRS